jgi:hypothetical protein
MRHGDGVMANEYLVAIHSFLSERIKDSENAVRSAAGKRDMAALQYHNGKLYELRQIQNYMSTNFNLETQGY